MTYELETVDTCPPDAECMNCDKLVPVTHIHIKFPTNDYAWAACSEGCAIQIVTKQTEGKLYAYGNVKV